MGMEPDPRPSTPGHDLPAGKPRVVVADDHGVLRQGMRLLLEEALPGCDVAEAGSFDGTLAALGAAPTEMLLLDLDMPGMNGVTSVRSLRTIFPDLKIAVVSGSSETQLIVDCITAGANGYVLKESPVEEVIIGIRSVFEGYVYVTPSLASAVHSLGMGGTADTVGVGRPTRFTSRQLDVLRQLKQGRSNKEIARELGLSEGTVKIHLAAIFRLLGARNRTEAVVLAGQLKV